MNCTGHFVYQIELKPFLSKMLSQGSKLEADPLIRPKKRNCLVPVTVRKKNRVGRSVKSFFFCIIILVKNVCFMHVLG